MNSLLRKLLPLILLLVPVAAWSQVVDLTLAEMEQLVSQSPDQQGYLLIDARPEIKFAEGYIDWAVSIPKAELQDRLDELPADKDTKLVFYCGGVKCKLSAESAAIAGAAGYRNVYTYSGGIPEWQSAGHIPWVSAQHVKMVLNDPQRIALLIDARPALKYHAGTIPGALNIAWPQFSALQGLLPADKNTQLIYFCGGHKCDLSHKSAKAAQQLGYTNLRVFAGGWPEWTAASKRIMAVVGPDHQGTAPAADAVAIEGEIAADDFLALVEQPTQQVAIVDVRPAEEFSQGHLPGAINILDEEVGKHIEQLTGYEKVVFYCNTGSRAAMAYYAAEAAGLQEKCSFLNKTVLIEANGNYKIQ